MITKSIDMHSELRHCVISSRNADYISISKIIQQSNVSQDSDYGPRSVEKLVLKSKHVGSLLGDMLHKKYPKFSAEHYLRIDDILEWNYWPAFMQIYGNVIFNLTNYLS